jgi:hypothetical protein
VSIYRLVVVQPQPILINLFKRAEASENRLEYIRLWHESREGFLAPRIALALAATCKLIHDEVVSVYFGENRFEFTDTSVLYRYLDMIGRQRRECIRNFEVW